MADPFPDPFAKEIRDNPYLVSQWLREDCPVYYNQDEGYWAISRYPDVLAAARNLADFFSAQGIGPGKVMGQTMLTSDPAAPHPPSDTGQPRLSIRRDRKSGAAHRGN